MYVYFFLLNDRPQKNVLNDEAAWKRVNVSFVSGDKGRIACLRWGCNISLWCFMIFKSSYIWFSMYPRTVWEKSLTPFQFLRFFFFIFLFYLGNFRCNTVVKRLLLLKCCENLTKIKCESKSHDDGCCRIIISKSISFHCLLTFHYIRVVRLSLHSCVCGCHMHIFIAFIHIHIKRKFKHDIFQ